MYMGFLLSIYMLITAIFVIIIPGFLFSLFLVRGEDRDNVFWPILPFLGVATSVLVLQNLVYLNIPLSKAAPIYFLISIFLSAIYWLKYKPKMPRFPKVLALIAILVIIVHGFGYFVVGARHYIGYGWIDQFNYTATAQFLMDKSFSTGLKDVGNVPYLVEAIIKKNDRIGQSILQGYIATIGATNAKTAYGATSLLSPFLTMLAIWMLAGHFRLTGFWRYGTTIASSIMPGLAMVHLECFLSQTLVIPLIIIWPIIINRVIQKASFHTIFICILILSAANSIYTEFTPIFIAIMLIAGVWSITISKNWFSGFANLILIPLGAVLVNYGFYNGTINLLKRTTLPNVLKHIYPFAYKIEGITRIWFGFPFYKINDALGIGANIISIILTLFAFLGLIELLRKRKDLIAVSLLLISYIPVFILFYRKPMPYQFYKILLTISPLLMLGVWILISSLYFSFEIERVSEENKKMICLGKLYIAKQISGVVLILLTAICMFFTAYLSFYSFSGKGRSQVKISHDEQMVLQYDALERLEGENILISSPHPYSMAWLTYHGRNNALWLLNNKVFGDVNFDKLLTNFAFTDLSNMPENVIIFKLNNYPLLTPESINKDMIALIENPQGIEGTKGSEFNWLGKKMILKIFSFEDRKIKLSFNAAAGLGHSDPKRILKLETPYESKEIEFLGNTKVTVPFTIHSGLNIIEFETIYPERTEFIPDNDRRDFLIRISGMVIEDINNYYELTE